MGFVFLKCNTTEKDFVPSGNIPGFIYCQCILVAVGFVKFCKNFKIRISAQFNHNYIINCCVDICCNKNKF